MCILCVMIDKERMSAKEIARAFVELPDEPHNEEILDKLKQNEDLEKEVFSEFFSILSERSK